MLRISLIVTLLGCARFSSVGAFSRSPVGCQWMHPSSCSSATASNANKNNDVDVGIPVGENYSTLTLLEHMHLLTPKVHRNNANNKNWIDFFVHTLGFGLDPKSIENIRKGQGVAFVNCGASQLHLNDERHYCQMMEQLQLQQQRQPQPNLPTFEIGLRYQDLSLLKEELFKVHEEVCTFQVSEDVNGRERIQITDSLGRIFVARESTTTNASKETETTTISSICQQPIVVDNQDASQYGSDIVDRYGRTAQSTTNCLGMDYIEFFVSVASGDDDGSTIQKIAKFYDYFLDAPTTVAHDGTSHIAIIGIGKIDENGRAEQSLLFRERPSTSDDIDAAAPKQGGVLSSQDLGTGHHIAIYVGATQEDYRVAATNFMEAGLLWVNPQFEDVVLDVEAAMVEKQFRIKDLVDVETGEVLYVLEHEIRSVNHPLFPGKRNCA